MDKSLNQYLGMEMGIIIHAQQIPVILSFILVVTEKSLVALFIIADGR